MRKHPKVSISYSWTNKIHENKVLKLYERLRYDGVDAKLDKVDVKLGNDLNKIMEELIKSKEIDFIIIISDKKYAEKANSRKGGVGTETKLLVSDVYNNPYQRKIIPTIWEYNNDKPCLPYYLESNYAIDFSDDEKKEEAYDQLLRHIYDSPLNEEPPLGEKPSYLDDKKITFNHTRYSIDKIKKHIKENPESINENSRDFFNNYLKDLNSIYFEKINQNDKELVSNSLKKHLRDYTVLRNYYINFFNFISRESYSKYLDSETITDFLEELKLYNKSYSNEYNSESESIFSHLIVYELFLYIIASCFKNKNYKLAHDLIYNPYYFKDINSEYDEEPKFYNEFNNHPLLFHKLKYYFQEWNYSASGNLLKKNLNSNFDFEELVDVDYILFYIGIMNFNFKTSWYPNLYIFKRNEKIELLKKMGKKSFFDKFKIIFEVNDSKEFINKANIPYKIIQEYSFPNYLTFVKSIDVSINPENIYKW